jgi:predicted PurR-regulated permease PerM
MNLQKQGTLKQVILLALIVLIGITLIWQLYYFIPGVLGAITLYILTRQFYYKLTVQYKWKKWVAALGIIIVCVIIFLIPLWAVIQFLIPKLAYTFSHTEQLMAQGQRLLDVLRSYIPQLKITEVQIQEAVQKLALIVPGFLNATLSLLINFLTAIFMLYFMFIGGVKMESYVAAFLPMNAKNTGTLWQETRNMVVSNAIGIPILIFCQCIIAIIGYLIFGVQQPVIWGVLTGLASVLPVVGTMIIWVPVCIVVLASGKIGAGIGLALYCAIIVSNIDNVLRFTIMKKIGDVHPLITVFGVVVGLQLFGLMGLIFGPLLIAYFFILIKIYRVEFPTGTSQPVPVGEAEGPGGEKPSI